MDDRYQVGELTEETPFGKYFVAEDSFIQRKVQIFRFITPENVDESEWKEIYGASAADLGTVSHPGLPIIYENGIDDEGPFAIRQLLESTTLNAHLISNGQVSEYEGWEIAHQILEIHDAATSSDNFHGALDANHIGFITRPSGEKRYSITDYGLAEIHNRIHKTNDYFGANYLISPEQLNGESITEQSQLYSIGQLIFHALCGGHPWTNVAIEDIASQAPLEPISAYNDAVPEEMDNWLAKLIAIDPADRFSTYAEAYEALPRPIQSAPVPVNTAAVSHTPAHTLAVGQTTAINLTPTQDPASHTAPQQTAPADKKKTYMIAGAAVLLIVVLIAVFSGGSDEETPKSSTAATSGTAQAADDLLCRFDFDSETLNASSGDLMMQLEPLKLKAHFGKKGLQSKGKSLQLDKNHFFRLSIENTPLATSTSDYTLNFWIMPTVSEERFVAVSSDSPWDNSEAASLGEKHLWTPKKTPVYGQTWNMVTLVCSRAEGEITVYIDGEPTGVSKSKEVSKQLSERYIYIGANNELEATQKNPVLIDNLSIWNRKFKPSEVKELFYK